MNRPRNFGLQKSGVPEVADAPCLLSVQNHEWKKYTDNNNHPNPPHQMDVCHNVTHTTFPSFLP